MVKKKTSNFTLISFTIIVSFIFIIIASIVKISVNQNNKLLYSMQSTIEYYAKRCYLEEKCQDEITLKDLYNKEYLTEVVNPVTKEILDENLKINYFNDQVIINWEEKAKAIK